MTSLRTRVAAPVLVVGLGFGLFASHILLSSLEHRLADELRLTVERQTSLLSSISLAEGRGLTLRGTALVSIRPDSTFEQVLPPAPPLSWASFDRGDSIPLPERFLDVPGVGLTLSETPTAWYASTEPSTRYAIVVSTRRAAQTYQELRVRLYLALVGSMLVLAIASLLVGERLARGIRQLTRSIAILTDASGQEVAFHRPPDELKALSDQVEVTRGILFRNKEEIERLQRVRSEFLANVSHEIRTPLFALKGYLETLLDGGMSDVRVSRDFLEKAQHHAQRLDVLLKDLIEISRIESGDMRLS